MRERGACEAATGDDDDDEDDDNDVERRWMVTKDDGDEGALR